MLKKSLENNLENNKDLLLSFLSLFTSFGTLICCALPALFVTLGMGATLAGIVGNFPALIWISEKKLLVFSLSFVLISSSAILQYRARNAPCPLNPELARACLWGRVWSRRLTFFSSLVWIVGASFAFLLS